LAEYYSALTEDLTIVDPRLSALEQRAQDEGIVIRPLALDRFREELGVLYRMVLASFQKNFLYTPIAEADFIAQYLPLQSFVRPELVLFAERGGEGVGFVFALPDFAQQKRGEAINTAIVKTIGVVPGRQNGGLGGLLLARCHEACLALGFKRAIHALMYESNVSRTLSSRYARSIRRYTLFQKDLRG
jgi:GNAT superfamily N-acetyltransferase